jgi:lysophospholipase L1-like esterase
MRHLYISSFDNSIELRTTRKQFFFLTAVGIVLLFGFQYVYRIFPPRFEVACYSLFFSGIVTLLISSVTKKFIFFSNILLRIGLCFLFLPLVELAYIQSKSIEQKKINSSNSEPVKPVYSYKDAQGDLEIFKKWWNKFTAEAAIVNPQYLKQTPNLPVPWLLKPNVKVKFLKGEININSYGFSGKEFQVKKGNKFRIVTMGASHTFGPGLHPGDDQWPLVLERLVNKSFPMSGGIEVINAAAPAYNIKHSLYLLTTKVVSLKPDLIIAYHGSQNRFIIMKDLKFINAFGLTPSTPRSLKSIQIIENRFRKWFNKVFTDNKNEWTSILSNKQELKKSELYGLYRKFSKITNNLGIPLVSATFNMAVNETSPKKVKEFYEPSFPGVKDRIKANRINNEILRTHAEQSHNVYSIETGKNLHGEYLEHYTDLVHLNKEGKIVLATNIFNGIKPILHEILDDKGVNLPK